MYLLTNMKNELKKRRCRTVTIKNLNKNIYLDQRFKSNKTNKAEKQNELNFV